MTGRADARSGLRLVVVGAGPMGRQWMRAITASDGAVLAGVVDVDVAVAKRAIADEQIGGVAVGPDLEVVVSATGADAIVNVTAPHAHHDVSSAAMRLGLPVLTEKPVTPTVAAALSLAATSEVTGTLLMVSQSRRYYHALRRFRQLVAAVGPVGVLATQFFRAPHFGGFRDQMDEPLLIDMAIHAFDAARFVLDDAPVTVQCRSFNPSWSWYRGAAAADALFTFSGGTRYSYLGSWCSPGLETSWNGQWRASGANGTATWDGDREVRAVAADGEAHAPPAADSDRPEEIAGSLAEFVDAVRTGVIPSGEVHDNVMSLAMVEAAVQSSQTGHEVAIEEVFERALASATSAETDQEVRDQLTAAGPSLWKPVPVVE